MLQHLEDASPDSPFKILAMPLIHLVYKNDYSGGTVLTDRVVIVGNILGYC